MPNDNMSFNSIDELQHFHTTEDPFVMGALPGATFSDGRLIDSGRFLTEPSKRETFDTDIGEVFGQPVVGTGDDCTLLMKE